MRTRAAQKFNIGDEELDGLLGDDSNAFSRNTQSEEDGFLDGGSSQATPLNVQAMSLSQRLIWGMATLVACWLFWTLWLRQRVLPDVSQTSISTGVLGVGSKKSLAACLKSWRVFSGEGCRQQLKDARSCLASSELPQSDLIAGRLNDLLLEGAGSSRFRTDSMGKCGLLHEVVPGCAKVAQRGKPFALEAAASIVGPKAGRIGFERTILHEGVKAWSDHDFVFRDVPARLLGGTLLRGPVHGIGRGEVVILLVSQPALVYVFSSEEHDKKNRKDQEDASLREALPVLGWTADADGPTWVKGAKSKGDGRKLMMWTKVVPAGSLPLPAVETKELGFFGMIVLPVATLQAQLDAKCAEDHHHGEEVKVGTCTARRNHGDLGCYLTSEELDFSKDGDCVGDCGEAVSCPGAVKEHGHGHSHDHDSALNAESLAKIAGALKERYCPENTQQTREGTATALATANFAQELRDLAQEIDGGNVSAEKWPSSGPRCALFPEQVYKLCADMKCDLGPPL